MGRALRAGGVPGKLRPLIFYVDTYGNQLEADFQTEYRLNLGRLLRSGQVGRTLRLIEQLPRTSRFSAAVASNPEHVQAILKATGDQREEYSPPLTEWTAQNEQLAQLVDLMEKLIGVQVSRGGGKAQRIKPSARPKTAFRDARTTLAKQQHQEMVARMKRARRTVD